MQSLEEYAESRGFRAEEFEEYRIRFEGGALYVPILGRNGTWYEKVKYPDSPLLTPKGEKPHLYNPWGLGPHSPEVWITEGEWDCLCLLVARVPAVGCPGVGTFLQAWRHLFEGAEHLVIAFDSDDAGQQGADKLAYEFGGWSEQVTRFDPSPYKDLNDWFKDDYDSFEEAVHSHVNQDGE